VFANNFDLLKKGDETSSGTVFGCAAISVYSHGFSYRTCKGQYGVLCGLIPFFHLLTMRVLSVYKLH
jgi:hypothetical protein